MLIYCNTQNKIWGGKKNRIRSHKKYNHIWFHIICCFPKVPNFSNRPKDVPFHSLCRNTSVLSRARETTLKPNMCSSPFITLGCLAAACVPPLLQSILFNSLGPCLVNKICTFLQVFLQHVWAGLAGFANLAGADLSSVSRERPAGAGLQHAGLL